MQIRSSKKKLSDFRAFLESILKGTRPLQDLFQKLNNDWDMNSASGLAYNLMTAMVPIGIALIAVFGLTVGKLDAQATSDLIARIQQIFPATVHITDVVSIALQSL